MHPAQQLFVCIFLGSLLDGNECVYRRILSFPLVFVCNVFLFVFWNGVLLCSLSWLHTKHHPAPASMTHTNGCHHGQLHGSVSIFQSLGCWASKTFFMAPFPWSSSYEELTMFKPTVEYDSLLTGLSSIPSNPVNSLPEQWDSIVWGRAFPWSWF